jgi:hypothetical protein
MVKFTHPLLNWLSEHNEYLQIITIIINYKINPNNIDELWISEFINQVNPSQTYNNKKHSFPNLN